MKPIVRPAGEKAKKAWAGRRVGRWTVVDAAGYTATDPNGLHLHCRCECGRTAIVSSANLRNGNSTQCWECGRRDAGKRLVLLPRVPRPPKHREYLRVVAARAGISKQRVHQLVAQHGWKGAVRRLKDRK